MRMITSMCLCVCSSMGREATGESAAHYNKGRKGEEGKRSGEVRAQEPERVLS